MVDANDWASRKVRELVIRALLCAAAEFERLAEVEARK